MACFVLSARVASSLVLSMVAAVASNAVGQSSDTNTQSGAETKSLVGASPGIVSEAPKSGPFVPLDGGAAGFMVPYVQELGETGIAFEMMPVPGGRMRLGSSADEKGHRPDEGPTYEVELEPYWVGKTEVSWREFSGFMQSYQVFKNLKRRGIRKVTTENRVDAVTVPTPLYAVSIHKQYGEDPQHPAVTMTQFSAKQYTKWLSGLTGSQYRLPTEAEWEFAARAGANTAFCFGDDVTELDTYAAHSRDDQQGSALVGSKKPNAYGLHDMHGNVWEWTVEQYDPKRYEALTGTVQKGFQSVAWPVMVDKQCIRGGCWSDGPEGVRSAVRNGSDHQDWSEEDPTLPTSPWWYTSNLARKVGFRIVRSARPLPPSMIQKFWDNAIVELQDDINESLHNESGGVGLPVPELLNELPSAKRK